MTNWRMKTYAYLHDPPDKPLALGRRGGHAEWGRSLASRLVGEVSETEWQEWEPVIRLADRIASGAERAAFLPSRRPSLDELRHPLSGQQIDISWIRPDPEAASAALDQEFNSLAGLGETPEAAFLAVWGLLPWRLRSRRGAEELGGLWDLLPAETRMPNHSVIAHQALVSALATVLAEGDEAVLLSFSVGPVQRFIAQARRVSDLWAGSALLSRALLRAALPIVEQLGPDHIVFPALRRSHLFMDEWLLADQTSEDRCVHADRLRQLRPAGSRGERLGGGLPNRFVAILPARSAEMLARQGEARLRQWLDNLAMRECRPLESPHSAMGGFAEMARAQVAGCLRVTWAGTPWPLLPDIAGNGAPERVAAAAWLLGGRLPERTRAYLDVADAVRQGAGRDGPAPRGFAFKPNAGVLYGACYETVERLAGAAKLTRLSFPRPEDGLKCTLCGERGVVPGALRFEEQRALWGRLRKDLGPVGTLRRGEALCGVCWIKRQFGRGHEVPSTSEIAATPFKLRVLRCLEALTPEVRALCEAVEKDGRFSGAFVVPALLPLGGRTDLHRRFLRVQGEALLANPREDREADDDEPPVEVMQAARQLRRTAQQRCGIQPPRPYLAVFLLDGDEMGKWLSGEKNLPLRSYLSGSAIAALEEAGLAQYLAEDAPAWPMTPALHASVSEACAVFSQTTAPRTLHDDGLPAFLIYSGGDDVMALTPIGCPDSASTVELATEAVLRLRLRFAGRVRRRDGDSDAADASSDAGYVLDRREGLAIAFGNRATASAGLAVFHHRWPLGRALDEARRAEEHAKDNLGRDALGIRILRRSGQITRTGLRFHLEEEVGGVRALQTLCQTFASGGLSPRFVAEIRQRLAQFRGGLPGEALLAVTRPLVHEALSGHVGDSSLPSIAQIAKALDRLAEAARPPASKRDGEAMSADSKTPRDLTHLNGWLDLIEVAAFLGRGDEP